MGWVKGIKSCFVQGFSSGKARLTICFGGLGVKGSLSEYSVWMRVCVLYFGVLKDVVGCGRSEMDLAEGASVAELLEVRRGLAKGAESVWDSIAVAVNQEDARAGDGLKDGGEGALLAPGCGGGVCFCRGGEGRRARGVVYESGNGVV